jgi:hypothetical protein
LIGHILPLIPSIKQFISPPFQLKEEETERWIIKSQRILARSGTLSELSTSGFSWEF